MLSLKDSIWTLKFNVEGTRRFLFKNYCCIV